MRHVRPATDRHPPRRSRLGPAALAGLFCAVWALALQVSLPLAIQLTPGGGPATYDLAAAVTGRIHSGHGTGGNDHSLPVQPELAAVLIKSEAPALNSAGLPTPAPYQPTQTSLWSGAAQASFVPTAIHSNQRSRAPPSFRHVLPIA